MAVQYNDITKIGDSFEIHTNTPIIGVLVITGFTDIILNETVDRYFYKEFRYSLNGITYSDWIELTDENLQNTYIPGGNIFDIYYRYTRVGTDNTGFLTFISITLSGTIEVIDNPKIFEELYFNKFFNYNDSSVLRWAINVLDKLYQKGIVANYVLRNDPNIDDEDYLSFWGSLTHFFAILVRYAREFKDFTLNDILLTSFLRQRGVFVNDGMTLSDLQILLSNLYKNFLERGTNEITRNTTSVKGELFRLINKSDLDEFVWSLSEIHKNIWNINNNSPLYRGTKSSINMIKAYEFTEDFEDLDNYPIVNSSVVSLYDDSGMNVMKILNANAPEDFEIFGIGDAVGNDKLILIDTRLSYEITFLVKQVILGDYLSCKVYLYNEDQDLLLDSPVSAINGVIQTNIAIDKQSLLMNDKYYRIRIILFNENISADIINVLDVGFGNHLILNNSAAKYLGIELGIETESGGTWNGANELRIHDFKVRPLELGIPNSFVMIANSINSYINNNSDENNLKTERKISRFLLPYDCVLINQFLDELYLRGSVPLHIVVTHTDETIIGSDNGTITIVAYGGSMPYLYSIDNGLSFQDSGVFTNLSPSTYDIVVKDSLNVQVTDTVVIGQGISNLTISVHQTPSSRLDVADGIITILGSGGVAPYFYSINGIDYYVSGVFTGLLAGNYTCYLKDTNGNLVTDTISVTSIRNRTIVFNVKDENAANILGVNINVIGEDYLTDGSGNVTIYLADGLYTFVISKSGYRSLTLSNINITADANFNEIINNYYSLTFNVDDGSNPLDVVKIEAITVPATQSTFIIYTDGTGQVIQNNVIAGSYVFRVSKSKYATQDVNVTVDGNEIINISLVSTMVVVDITTTGAGNWIAPVGVIEAVFECWGAGGSGGGAGFYRYCGGGAGAQYAKRTLTGSLGGNNYVYYVAPQTNGNIDADGSTGNDTVVQLVSDICRAKGGAGGKRNGTIALGSATGGVGDIVYKGGNGGAGNVPSGWSGGGGGGAGSLGNGQDAEGSVAGVSTNEYGGEGGDGIFGIDANGINGLNYGSGGSGAIRNTTPGSIELVFSGGKGAQGRIRITYYT